MNDLVQTGLTQKLISFDVDQKSITYVRQNKRLRFSDPEEKVRANAYLSLVFDYGYCPEQIDIEVTRHAGNRLECLADVFYRVLVGNRLDFQKRNQQRSTQPDR